MKKNMKSSSILLGGLFLLGAVRKTACMPHGRKMMLLRQHLQKEKAMSVMMPLPLYWKADLFTVTVKEQ